MFQWYIFGVIAIISKSTFTAIQKRYISLHNPFRLSFLNSFYGMLFILPLAIYFTITREGGVTTIPITISIIAGVLESFVLLLYLKAIESDGQEIANPLQSVSPLFVVFLEPFIRQYSFEPFYLLPASLVILGGWFALSSIPRPKWVLQKGGLFALSSAILYSFFVFATKYGTEQLTPVFYGFIVFSTIVFINGFILFRKSDFSIKPFISDKKYIGIGSFGALQNIFVWSVYWLIPATVAIIFLRSVIILDVIIGILLFSEEFSYGKIVGIMLVGVGVGMILHPELALSLVQSALYSLLGWLM